MERQLDRLGDSISAMRSNASPTKSPSPNKFVNKYSNLTGYAVWDVDGRVGDMESQFKELKDMVNTSLTETKRHDDAIELAKTRGMRFGIAHGTKLTGNSG